MPATNSFPDFVRGEDCEIDFTIRQTAKADAPVQDITGWTFSCKLKRKDEDPDPPVVSMTVTTLVAVAGTLKATLTAALTAPLDGDYRYSLWRTNAGFASCLSQGVISFGDSTEDAAG